MWWCQIATGPALRSGGLRLLLPFLPWSAPADGLTVYMGRDKFENEELIKHMWPEDVWFHVDDLSSAHVYLRLPLVSYGRH